MLRLFGFDTLHVCFVCWVFLGGGGGFLHVWQILCEAELRHYLSIQLAWHFFSFL